MSPLWLGLSRALAWAAFKLLDASVVLYIRSEGGPEKLARKLGRVAAAVRDTNPDGSLN